MDADSSLRVDDLSGNSQIGSRMGHLTHLLGTRISEGVPWDLPPIRYPIRAPSASEWVWRPPVFHEDPVLAPGAPDLCRHHCHRPSSNRMVHPTCSIREACGMLNRMWACLD